MKCALSVPYSKSGIREKTDTEREWKRKRKEERREDKVLLASVMKESGMIESMKMPEKV